MHLKIKSHQRRRQFLLWVATCNATGIAAVGCSSSYDTSKALQRYCEIAKSTITMGGRPPLEDHEIWEEWEKTKPTEDAKATLAEFFDRVIDAQGERGTAQVSGKDINELMIGVATNRGFEPPNCGEFWDDRARRWTDDARRNDLTDLCRAYASVARESGNENLGTSVEAHETTFRAITTEWLNQRTHQARTTDFVDALLAKPTIKRGETFGKDLKAFLKGYENEAVLCRKLQEHLEALSKRAKGEPVGE